VEVYKNINGICNTSVVYPFVGNHSTTKNMNLKKNISKSFKLSLVIIILLIIAIISSVINMNNGISLISRYLIGLPILLSGILGIIGAIYFFKGLREPKNYKFIVSLITYLGIITIFLLLIIANIMDFYKSFT